MGTSSHDTFATFILISHPRVFSVTPPIASTPAYRARRYTNLSIATAICKQLFSHTQKVPNHCCFAEDALVASGVSLNPAGRQPCMREGFDHARGLPHPLVFSDNHPNLSLRGKAKGAEAILRERSLWPNSGWRSDGFKFKLECPKKRRKDGPIGTDASGCNPEMDNTTGCCARRVLSQQQDFRAQKGQLQEEVGAANHLIIFYPKSHCELNFIERFWCAAKCYARENCEYSFDGLRISTSYTGVCINGLHQSLLWPLRPGYRCIQ